MICLFGVWTKFRKYAPKLVGLMVIYHGKIRKTSPSKNNFLGYMMCPNFFGLVFVPWRVFIPPTKNLAFYVPKVQGSLYDPNPNFMHYFLGKSFKITIHLQCLIPKIGNSMAPKVSPFSFLNPCTPWDAFSHQESTALQWSMPASP